MENQFFSVISAFLSFHPKLGIGFAFLVAFLESLAIIGSIVPGSITLTAVGILIGMGILSSTETLIAAILGAFLGDTLSFCLGKRYAKALLERWPFSTYPRLVQDGEKFFAHYGQMGIFVGRFVGPIRCILPVAAGILNMSTTRFIVSDFLSAVIWAPAYLLPGILIGVASLELEPNTGARLLLISFLILVFIWLSKIIINYFIRVFQRQLLKLSLQFEHRFPKTHQHFYRDHQVRIRTVVIFMSLAFFSFLAGLVKSGHADPLNHACWHFIQNFRFLNLESFFTSFTLIADKKVVIPTCTLLTLFWLYMKETKLACLLFITISSTSILGFLLKHLIAYPRPDGVMIVRPSFSFPSGHTLEISSLLIFIYLCMSHYLKRPSTAILRKSIGAIIFMVMFSRLYLGAHWLSDVLGGLSLAGSIAAFFASYYIPSNKSQRFVYQSLLALGGCWLISIAIFGLRSFNKELTAYQLSPLQSNQMSVSSWWQQNSSPLPLIRTNYIGEADTTFNLQWLDTETSIDKKLSQAGWQKIMPFGWISFADRLAHFGSKDHLPLFPKTFHFTPAALIYTKQLQANEPLLIIRLWPAPLKLNDAPTPLWIGSVHYRFIWHLPHHSHTTKHKLASIENALAPILSQYKWRMVHYPVKIKQSPELESPEQFFIIKK